MKKEKKILEKLTESSKFSAIIDIDEFSKPISGSSIIDLLDGQILSGEKYLKRKIYGYTVLDSIHTIYAYLVLIIIKYLVQQQNMY